MTKRYIEQDVQGIDVLLPHEGSDLGNDIVKTLQFPTGQLEPSTEFPRVGPSEEQPSGEHNHEGTTQNIRIKVAELLTLTPPSGTYQADPETR